MRDYSIGWLKGERVLVFWRDGKRSRHRLGTADPREAERRAPAVYAELTRPKGKAVADLWQGYITDKSGRAVLVTMHHTWKALERRFSALSGDSIYDCGLPGAHRRTPEGRNQGRYDPH